MLHKKLVTLTLFLITMFFFISCAKKDDDSSSSTSSFAPPSWIHGAWVDNVSSSSKSGYKFDSSDVYMVFGGTLSAGLVAAGGVTEHITSTDSEFSFATGVTCGSGDTSTSGNLTYVFAKETTSTLKLTGSSTASCGSIAETTYTKDTSL